MTLTPMKSVKMWIGNLDGDRQGLVIARSKARAIDIIRTSRGDFDNHWAMQPVVDQSLEFEVLYTKPIRYGDAAWQKGRCPK